jgi:hypothetical protein
MQANLSARFHRDADPLTRLLTKSSGDTAMPNTTKHADARQIRDLSSAELDAITGGAATKPKEPFPGPCFPRPKPPLQVM